MSVLPATRSLSFGETKKGRRWEVTPSSLQSEEGRRKVNELLYTSHLFVPFRRSSVPREKYLRYRIRLRHPLSPGNPSGRRREKGIRCSPVYVNMVPSSLSGVYSGLLPYIRGRNENCLKTVLLLLRTNEEVFSHETDNNELTQGPRF